MRLMIPKGTLNSGQDVIGLIQFFYKVEEIDTDWADRAADKNRHFDVVIDGVEGRRGFYFDYKRCYTENYDIRYTTDSITLGEIQW